MFRRLKLAALVLLSLAFTLPATALGHVHVETVHSPLDAPGVQFECVYPHVSGIGNVQNQQKLNRSLREQALCAQKQAEYAAKAAPVRGSFGYEVTRNEGGTFSLVTTRTFTQNGRTGTVQKGVTVNTADGRVYSLSGLFVDHADYVGVLSEQVQAQIHAKGLTDRLRRPFKQIGAEQDFYLTKTELVLLFQQGESFTEDCGVQTFRISLQSLDGTLKPVFRL
ncbi:DUF3298 and DUF4163 domain-containing protein [Ethanoligenens harbinense]|uniref:DUF3298 domain-containing protein n=1 Tax=Ethanoligenens harbinense (strain DSM 18485 / JCM 12961 / CGMCC 1.5033 / YUAN-3) TaxID=663278 RepID=E6U355_ETHHY|nr:DUF3298 domain-containing protein [Ethanoligenens harbinense]ADU27527.1 hypothetical protein Ethha_2009 [Ethanoligenens harbinense YUAN-3]